MKLSFCCISVLLAITANAVFSTPVEETDGMKGKTADSSTTSTSPATDMGQDRVSDEDVARFLEDMRRLRSRDSYNTLAKSLTDSVVARTTSQTPDFSTEVIKSKFDVTILLAIGVASAVLLVVLAAAVVAIFICCKSGKSARKDMALNSDFNRWDPQLLRPNKANIDAFIFGSPIPSVTEMIKQ